MTKNFIWLFLAALLLSCSDAENEFTDSACYLVIDNSVHQDPILSASMNVNAPGVFCIVSRALDGGAGKYVFTDGSGRTSQRGLNSADLQRPIVIGYNNGLIVGYGSLSSPLTFYAFDRECPNCFNPNQLPVRSRPLTIATNGLATCHSCNRQYDMNNGGIVAKGQGGKKLTRYRSTSTGPLGTLVVR